jgi:hypothetical protein
MVIFPICVMRISGIDVHLTPKFKFTSYTFYFYFNDLAINY